MIVPNKTEFPTRHERGFHFAVVACFLFIFWAFFLNALLGSWFALIMSPVVICFGIVAIQSALWIWQKLSVADHHEQVTLQTKPHQQYLDIGQFNGVSGVYILHDVTFTGYYKIGRAECITPRIKELSSTKLPLELDVRLYHVIPCSNPAELERQLHNLFRLQRRRGEWFELDEIQLLRLQSAGRTIAWGIERHLNGNGAHE